ncbi:sulfate transporter [Schizosaccharomyces cryophilus OY26]|uniref:Sulfate transporter n=1 Tax=Schizosaccharomyces cryophilus (strain OY26 / ATCC MYA-4695 / CBS 11777 / NBRC 106824 / NRRL Y48691) TaxID=653667 RepID=S9W8L8_SCHCR|nr:sulfate transporter [Schizosaccharomyces cryophilus OY26]EPY54230.1 sulfate transporter [Schizosaccharomyces cryophilus OY26]
MKLLTRLRQYFTEPVDIPQSDAPDSNTNSQPLHGGIAYPPETARPNEEPSPSSKKGPTVHVVRHTVLNQPNNNNNTYSYSSNDMDVDLSYGEYDERLPNVLDWFRQHITHDLGSRSLNYVKSLFPIIQWLPNYNFHWLIFDLIAGITVGCIVVPQGMSYAKVAGLPAEYGLYSSFVGVAIYCFFATSKDVSIGPVAVMSLVTSEVIKNVSAKDPTYTAPEIGSCLALLAGAITCGIGLLRLGFIIEFIPIPAVAGFTTGSALNIISGQVSSLMGYKKLVSSHGATYRIIIDTLKNLPHTKVDAAFGLFFTRRYPKFQRIFFLINVLRSAVIIIIGTAISYGVCKGRREHPPISILLTVPKGFQHVGVPNITKKLCSDMASELPVSVIVLLLEHISIAKSFGRINDYKVIPDQELIAMGVTNLIGVFFNAYPATGSFSRSAIKAKSGVRTPLAGIFTAAVVILALYCLTGAFYYIPNAVLSAVIIHSVFDLILPWRQLVLFWRMQPLEALIFLAAVFVSVFSSIENGIYTAVCLSAALLLFRIAKPSGSFLGILKIANKKPNGDDIDVIRDIYVPLDQQGVNPNLFIRDPPQGVLIFRLQESFTYPNAQHVNSMLTSKAKEVTRRGKTVQTKRKQDRAWNDPPPKKQKDGVKLEDNRPLLRAIILDFSAVNHIDTTGVQSLVDTRKELELYADDEVEFHFTDINSGWIKRTLIAAGFGKPRDATKYTSRSIEVGSAAPLRDIENPMVTNSSQLYMPSTVRMNGPRRQFDEEEAIENGTPNSEFDDGEDSDTLSSPDDKKDSVKQLRSDFLHKEYCPVISTKYPFFHVDVTSAIVDISHRNVLDVNLKPHITETDPENGESVIKKENKANTST